MPSRLRRTTTRRIIRDAPRAACLLLAATLAGCGVNVEPLMPTPVLYTECGFDPLVHIPANQQWTPRRVYYATTRTREGDGQEISYGNRPSEEISAGLALIGFGGHGMSWSELNRASSQATRDEVVPLSITGIVEAVRFPADLAPEEAAEPNRTGWLIQDLNDAIEDSRDPDLMIYVHGAKVNFYNACAFAAQIDHFAGRDMTSLAFSWPTRQDIFAYVSGGDVARAYDAAPALATLVEVLASTSKARRLHVLCWSAGARVTTRMFEILRERHPDVPLEELRGRLRIGTAYFAAGDVPTSEFIDALPVIHALSDRAIVTVSSNDEALKSSSRFMGGGGRIGQLSQSLTDEQVAQVEAHDRIEIVNVSLGSEDRGFDITGHRYWFNHPWASSDMILALRTDLAPGDRGLLRGEGRLAWRMPPDYPQRLTEILRSARLRSWE